MKTDDSPPENPLGGPPLRNAKEEEKSEAKDDKTSSDAGTNNDKMSSEAGTGVPAESAVEAPAKKKSLDLPIGSRVRVHKCKSKPELAGEAGVLLSYDESSRLFTVKLDGEGERLIKIRGSKLRPESAFSQRLHQVQETLEAAAGGALEATISMTDWVEQHTGDQNAAHDRLHPGHGAKPGWFERMSYDLVNLIDADPSSRFYILIALSALASLVLGLLWNLVTSPHGDHASTTGFFGSTVSANVSTEALYNFCTHRCCESLASYYAIFFAVLFMRALYSSWSFRCFSAPAMTIQSFMKANDLCISS